MPLLRPSFNSMFERMNATRPLAILSRAG
jgi:hypothetical protein